MRFPLLLVSLFLLGAPLGLAAESFEEAQQRLDAECEAAREAKLAPERECYIQECVEKKQRPDRGPATGTGPKHACGERKMAKKSNRPNLLLILPHDLGDHLAPTGYIKIIRAFREMATQVIRDPARERRRRQR